MEGNKTLRTEIIKPGPSQQSVLRIPGLPGVPGSMADYQNNFTNDQKWSESNSRRSYPSQVSYPEENSAGLRETNNEEIRRGGFLQNGEQNWSNDAYYKNGLSFYNGGQSSGRSSPIYSQSSQGSSRHCLSSTSHDNRDVFSNQNYRHHVDIYNRDKLMESYHKVKHSDQNERQVDRYSRYVGENMSIRQHNNIDTMDHDTQRNSVLKDLNQPDQNTDKLSEVDSVLDDGEFVGSDDCQQEQGTTQFVGSEDSQQEQGTTQCSREQLSTNYYDNAGIFHTKHKRRMTTANEEYKRSELVTDSTERQTVETQIKRGTSYLRRESADLIADLLRCNASLDITQLYQMDKLLRTEDGVKTTLYTLGDEIVNKLVKWTKQLPFYPEIPVEEYSTLLSSKWHELLLLITAAYNALHRPRLKDLGRDELYQRNMDKLKVGKNDCWPLPTMSIFTEIQGVNF